MVVLNPQDQSEGAQRRVARTDMDGAFVLKDIVPADYGFEVSRTGFVTDYKEARLLPSGEEMSRVDFSLAPAGVVLGVIIDEDKEPVEGVKVEILRPTYLPGGILQLLSMPSAITDEQGLFRISGLIPADYYLRAGGLIEPPVGRLGQSLPLEESSDHSRQYRDVWFPEPAIQDGSTPFHLEAGAELNVGQIQVSTEPTWSIKGKIEGEAPGVPKPTEVHCVKDQPFEQMFEAAGTVVQPDGSFVLKGLPTGGYTLTAISSENGSPKAVGYADAHILDRNVVANVQLGQAGRIRGTITSDRPDQPGFRDIPISIGAVNQDRLYLSSVDSKGIFDIQNVPPGAYTFGLFQKQGGEIPAYPREVSCSGADYSSQPITITVGSLVNNCEISLSYDFGTVSGRVKGIEQHQPNLTVVLIPQSRHLRRIPRYTLTANTDNVGHYEIQKVIPGNYFLFAVTPDSEQRWFALGFAEAHQDSAVSVSVAAGQHTHSDLIF